MGNRVIAKICLNCFGDLNEKGFCFKCRRFSDDKSSSWDHLPLRTVLNGKYLIAKVLGQGGFGITYMAWDCQHGRKVAIKEFFPSRISRRLQNRKEVAPVDSSCEYYFQMYRDMFRAEVALMLKLRSLPGVVYGITLFEENNSLYFVMQYLDGLNLKKFVEMNGGRISVNRCLMMILPVMEALKVFHQMGLIHRDISPDNIILSDNNTVTLIDFGAATFYNNPTLKFITQMKDGFAPLEQYTANMPQGPWTDVYALAATIYSCTTGFVPFSSPTRAQADYLLPTSAHLVPITPIQEKALMKALAVYPQMRYQNIGEFIENMYGPAFILSDNWVTNPYHQ